LGLAIGLSQNELDIIEADNNFNQQECCRGMFNTWQARGKPPFMWSELIKITKSEENLHSVSKDINKRKAAIQKHKGTAEEKSQQISD
jgi:translation elongation factor EF-G